MEGRKAALCTTPAQKKASEEGRAAERGCSNISAAAAAVVYQVLLSPSLHVLVAVRIWFFKQCFLSVKREGKGKWLRFAATLFCMAMMVAPKKTLLNSITPY